MTKQRRGVRRPGETRATVATVLRVHGLRTVTCPGRALGALSERPCDGGAQGGLRHPRLQLLPL